MPDTNQGIKIMEENNNNSNSVVNDSKQYYVYTQTHSHLREMEIKEVDINNSNKQNYDGCIYFDEKWKAQAFIGLSQIICRVLEKL